ncbi:MAG TPA: hypothetical protein DCW33_03705 [Proteobacteria bacterium]|nr:hypothetical protein [Pseudomonadota bacterium]|tara:strand:+ start:1176 stop:1700 length:525 start_codon:yes stop_codon:yes gene_type:complete
MKATNKLINPLIVGAALLATSMCANAQTGVSFTNDSGTGYNIGYEMKSRTLETGISTNIVYNKPSGSGRSDYTTFFFGGYAGKRVTLTKDGIFSYGAMGSYGLYRSSKDAAVNSDTREPMVVGAYTGLAYVPSKSIELFTRLMPISYNRKNSNAVEIELFGEGAMGIKYFFSKK